MEGPGRRWLALWTSYLLFFGTGVLFFMVPPLLTEIRADIPMDAVAVGWLQGVYTLPAVLFALAGGVLLDRLDTKRAGIVSGLVMLGGNILFNVGADYALMMIGRFVGGVGAILINLVAAKMLSHWFREKELGLAMSVLHTAWPIGGIICFSTFVAGGEALGWQGTTLAINIFLAATVAAFALWAPREDRVARGGERAWRVREIAELPRDLWLTGGVWFCFTASMISVFTFGAGFLQESGWGYAAGSFVVGLIMWAATPGALAAGWLMDRFGKLKFHIVFPALGTALCLLGLHAGLHPAAMMLGAGLAANFLPVAVYALPAQIMPPARLGLAFGVILTFSNLGNTVGPVAAGWINTLTGSHATGMIAAAAVFAACAALAAPLAGYRLARARGRTNEEDNEDNEDNEGEGGRQWTQN